MLLKFECLHQLSPEFQLDLKFQTRAKITGLVGPSGSGKTTILSLIAGLIEADQAIIQLGEHLLQDTANKIFVPPEQRKTGLLFQDKNLFPHMRVDANIRYGYRRSESVDFDLSRIIDRLELSGLLDRFPASLSGGQKQRVALARAIASGPDLLLLDEPLSSLDHKLRSRVVEMIRLVVEEFKIPAIVVSHEIEWVRELAQSVVEVNRGQLVSIT